MTTALHFWVLHQVVRHSDHDKVTVIGAGVTLHEALAAAEELSKQGQLVLVTIVLPAGEREGLGCLSGLVICTSASSVI